MKPYMTDVGTLSLIRMLGTDGRRRLASFLDRCDVVRTQGAKITETFERRDFEGRSDIVLMTLERRNSVQDHKILGTTDFSSGARWRRGSLRIPNTELPSTIMSAIKGRLIEEVVGGAPLTGYTITSAVHDRSSSGTTLRIRTSGEELAHIDGTRR